MSGNFNAREVYHTFDQPVPFKELLFYPVRMKDYYNLSFFSTSLMLEKTADPDPIKTIPMSYLDYLFYASSKEDGISYIYLLDGLLRLCLNKTESKDFEIRYYKNELGFAELSISGKTISAEDFYEIRKIICEQNDIELPDESIQKTVRDAMEKARRYKLKMLGRKVGGLEDQMVALSIYTGWSLNNIYEMTIRKFRMAVRRADHMIYQDAYLHGEMGGMVSFKDKSVLSGWLADISNEDRYNDVKMDLGELKEKADFSSAKK